MNAETRAALAQLLDGRIEQLCRVTGGDINEAFLVSLADGRRVFAKSNPHADPESFAAEARGLRWLAEAGALPVPEVLGVFTGAGLARPFLLLEWLEPGRRRVDFDERLGAGLARLHRFGAPSFGFERDNFIGSLPQSNQPSASWAEFYGERRLLPQLRRARDHGLIDARLQSAMERLLSRLEALVGPPELPARLHGDLWSGNLHTNAAGQPCLIDPAAYGGHREIDLAMMRLFGGFDERVFDAYAATYPLAPGCRERVGLYQLYPLLVHVNLFGSSYAGQLREVLEQYA